MSRDDRDAGAYMVLYALLAVAIFAVAAVVLDLAALRQGRRADRAAADLAATAAAGVLEVTDPATYSAACQAAWDYVVLNRDDADGTAAPPGCAAAFPAAACDPATPATATGTFGPLTVSITYPVPAGDLLMLSEVQGGDQPQASDPSVDGSACERVGVRVQRTRTFLFGRLAGVDAGRTDVHAVARNALASTTRAPGIVALEATGCDGLTVSANGVVVRAQGVAAPGYIVADSTASACAGFVIDVQAPGSLLALPSGAQPGIIESRALGAGNVAAAFDGADLAAGRLGPAPRARSFALGRDFIDTRYGAAITALRTALGGAGVPAPYNGIPFIPFAPLGCSVAAPTIVPAGNYFVDCPTLVVSSSITFMGGTVVFSGGLQVDDNACFALNHNGCGAPVASEDNVLFLRSGDLVKAEKGDLFLNRTIVHLTGAPASTDGRIRIGPDFSGGATDLAWSPPAAGAFEDLAAWSDSGADMSIGGQGSTATNGTFFTPNARLTLVPRPGGSVLGGQFVVRRLHADGNSELRVVTDAAVATTTQTRSVRLVR